jgi:hypothetical protein
MDLPSLVTASLQGWRVHPGLGTLLLLAATSDALS